MIVYELTHLFYRWGGQIIHSPKGLGYYTSEAAARDAIAYYCTCPGFCDNPDAFSLRALPVTGEAEGNRVFEVLVYLHTQDYAWETSVELGLYGEEQQAQARLREYASRNGLLLQGRDLICEKIVNKCVLDRRDWPEGFAVEG